MISVDRVASRPLCVLRRTSVAALQVCLCFSSLAWLPSAGHLHQRRLRQAHRHAFSSAKCLLWLATLNHSTWTAWWIWFLSACLAWESLWWPTIVLLCTCPSVLLPGTSASETPSSYSQCPWCHPRWSCQCHPGPDGAKTWSFTWQLLS